jgi:hypothetical protein
MTIKPHQEVFMLFFAIFWGLIANVQPRWKAFQYPLFLKLTVATRRVVLAFCLMNLAPVVYFGITLWIIGFRNPTNLFGLVIQGVLPAFGMFGLYRLWLATVEWKPFWFYESDFTKIPLAYQHVEPTYRLSWNEDDGKEEDKKRKPAMPIVDLASGAALGNFWAGLVYIVLLAYLIPLLFWLYCQSSVNPLTNG